MDVLPDGGTLCLVSAVASSVIMDGLELKINRSVSIVGGGASHPDMDCGGRSRFLNITGSDIAVRVSGMTIRNGQGELGGAIYASLLGSSELTLVDLEFKACDARWDTDIDCSALSNWPPPRACVCGGGAIFVEGALRVAMGNIVARSCSSATSGGAIAFVDVHRVSIWYLRVHRAKARKGYGGGISIANTLTTSLEDNQTWVLRNSTFDSTTAAVDGGAVLFFTSTAVGSQLEVSDSTFLRTSSHGDGGGVAFDARGSIALSSWVVTSSRFVGTSALHGGGVAMNVNGSAINSKIVVQRSTFSAAHASRSGGGVYFWCSDSISDRFLLSVTSSSFLDTSADHSGGGVELEVDNDVKAHSRLLVTQCEFHNASANILGGGVSFEVQGDFTNSNLIVSRSRFSSCAAGVGGGVAVYVPGGTVAESLWQVAQSTMFNVIATLVGGGVGFYCGGSVAHHSLWLVTNSSLSRAHSDGNGGGVFYYVLGTVASSGWVVQHCSMNNVTARGSGAGVAFDTDTGMASGSEWVVESSTFSNAKAIGPGGSVYFEPDSMKDSRATIRGVHVMNTDAEKGGFASFLCQRPLNSSLEVESCNVSRANASSGGVLSIVSPGSDVTTKQTAHLHVTVAHVRVAKAMVKESGGVAQFIFGQPTTFPERMRALSCHTLAKACSGQASTRPCDLPEYRPGQVAAFSFPYTVDLAHVAAFDCAVESPGQGSFLTLANAAARLLDINISSDVDDNATVLELAGTVNISLDEVKAQFPRNSEATFLYHQGGPMNLSMASVWGVGLKSWTKVWTAMSVSVSNSSFGCPAGYVAKVDEGAWESTEVVMATKVTEQRVLPNCSVVNQTTRRPRRLPVFPAVAHCSPCEKGHYMPARQGLEGLPQDSGSAFPMGPSNMAECTKCPQGADCSNTTHVMPLRGHWGTTAADSEELISEFPVLLFGYACSAPDCLRGYNSCTGHRAAFACGKCREGYGEAIGSPNCISEHSCEDSWTRIVGWFMVPIMAALGVGGFLATSRFNEGHVRGEMTALVNILFTLFQIEGFVTMDEETTTTAFTYLANFQFVPRLPAGSLAVCLWPRMGAVAKSAVPAFMSGLLPTALLLTFGCHVAMYRGGYSTSAPSRAQYWKAFVSMMFAVYGSSMATAIRIATPLPVETYTRVQALTGGAWMRSPDQWGAVLWLSLSTLWAPMFAARGLAQLRTGAQTAKEFAVGVVLPVPLLVYRWAQRCWHRRGTAIRPTPRSQLSQRLYSVLVAPYRPAYWYWDAVMMWRRLWFGLLLLVSPSILFRGMAYVATSITLLAIHVHTKPFRSPAVNKVETSALVALTAMSLSSLLEAYHVAYGFGMGRSDLSDSVDLPTVRYIVAAAQVSVVVAAIAVGARRWIRYKVGHRAKNSSQAEVHPLYEPLPGSA